MFFLLSSFFVCFLGPVPCFSNDAQLRPRAFYLILRARCGCTSHFFLCATNAKNIGGWGGESVSGPNREIVFRVCVCVCVACDALRAMRCGAMRCDALRALRCVRGGGGGRVRLGQTEVPRPGPGPRRSGTLVLRCDLPVGLPGPAPVPAQA